MRNTPATLTAAATAAVLAALLGAAHPLAQTLDPPNAPTLAAEGLGEPVDARLAAMTSRLEAAVTSGAVPRSQADVVAATLRDVRTQREALIRRDGGLNGPDRQFLAGWLDEIATYYPVLAGPGSAAERLAFAPPPLLATAPGGLICGAREPVLLAVGRDRATAAVQRSMDLDVTLIAEAVAAPLSSTDTLSLRVRAPGLDTRIDAARAGTLLLAGTTSSFALKAGHTAQMSAEASVLGGLPHYVRIWGVCRPS